MQSATLTQPIYPGPSPLSGTGLFASKTILQGHPVLHIPEPLVATPDDAHLAQCCSGCMLWKPELEENSSSHLTYPDPDESVIKLSACTGCRVVRYCSRECQKFDWKRVHKHECPIYSRLFPRILPVSVRSLVRLLIRHKYGLIPQGLWGQILRLESHWDEYRSDPSRADMIPLMAKATHAYSETDLSEEVVRGLYCRILINSFAISTPPPSIDRIGNLFDVSASLINHSCAPNCVMEFAGKEVHVVALRDINIGEEITISYIDESEDVRKRKGSLEERWFFKCACERCEQEETEARGIRG